MRKFTILAAVAPLALLAACGDNDAAEVDTDADTMAADTDTTDTMDTADMDGDAATGGDVATAENFNEAGDFSGDYSYTAPDGTARNVKINSTDGTYEYTGADGQMKTGRYELDASGYRFRIPDFYGSPAFFAISRGQLVEVGEDVEVTRETDFSANRADRSQPSQSRAVFSRSPEPGSSVAPR